MFSWFNSLKVEEVGDYIEVGGLSHRRLELDFYRLYHTSKISGHMIQKLGSHKLRFQRFFAVEFAFLLTKVIEGKRMASDKRAIAHIRDLMFEKTWLYKVNEPNVKLPLDLKRLKDLDLSPKEYHQRFFEEYNRIVPRYQLRGMLLAGAPGSGKTYASIAFAHCAHAKKVIVICPINAVERVWEENVRLRHHGTKKVWTSQQDKPFDPAADYFVYHYEALEKALGNSKAMRSENTVIILDESHNLNETTANRTNDFLDLVEMVQPSHVLEDSGTPIKALGSESIPLFRAIDPLFTPEVEKTFKLMYGANATRTLEMLNHRMGLVSFKIEKDELGLDKPISEVIRVKTPDSHLYTLPYITDQVRSFVEQRIRYYKSIETDYTNLFFKLVGKARTVTKKDKEFDHYIGMAGHVHAKAEKGAYGEIKEDIIACTRFENAVIIPALSDADKKLFRDVRSAYKYVLLKIQGEALGRVIGRARIDCHLSMAKHIDYAEICYSTAKKTLVFTSFVEVLEQIADTLSKTKKFQPLVVYGKTSKDLNPILKVFETDPNANPLVATYKSLGTAVPLVMADTMLMVDAPFRTYILEQTISRINRLGADTQATIFTALLDTGEIPNISTRSSDILAWSQAQVKAIMGIDAPFKLEDEEQLMVSTENMFEHMQSAQAVWEEAIGMIMRPNRSMHLAQEDYGIAFDGALFELQAQPVFHYW